MTARAPVSALSALFESLGKMRDAWPGGGWSWDNRFQCGASTIPIELAQKGRAAAQLAMPSEWSELTVRNAPAPIADIATSAGGVRSDQLILTSAVVGGVVAYGLWWPWNNGITVSLRVGLHGAVGSELHKLHEILRIRDF